MNNATLYPEPTLTMLAAGHKFGGGIADQALAPVTSDTVTGYFGRVNGTYLRIVDTVKKGSSGKNFVTYKIDRNTHYEVVDHELSNEITIGEAERLGGWDAAKRRINAMLSMQIKLGEEYSLASVLTSASTLTRTEALAGGDRWDISTSSLLSKIRTAKESVATYTGQEANTIILGRKVFSAVQIHPELYTVFGANYKGEFGIIGTQQLAAIFGVKRVLVGREYYNSAKEGQTESYTSLWGNNCIVAYIADDATAEVDPGLGARIISPANLPTESVGSYIPEGEEASKVQVLKQNRAYSNTLINTDAAYLITTCVS